MNPLNVKIKTQVTKEFTRFFMSNTVDDPKVLTQIHEILEACNRHIDRLTKNVDNMDQ